MLSLVMKIRVVVEEQPISQVSRLKWQRNVFQESPHSLQLHDAHPLLTL